MKKGLLLALLAVLLAATAVHAANVGFDLNVNVSNQPRVAVPAPPPAPVPVVIEEPPEFIAPTSLGFYVSVGAPYDMFYISNQYYLYRGDVWYRSVGYNGPWISVRYETLPYGLRKHRYERIREVRDAEYRVYAEHQDRYHGRHFRPEKEWKERRKEEKREWKEEKRRDKEERKHGKHKKHDDD